MNSPSNAPDPDLEKWRPYLTSLARQQLDHRLRPKVDLSGVVNQTLYEAHRRSGQVRGRRGSDWLAWLRRILARRLIDAVRPFRGRTRDITREVPLESRLEQSSVRLADWLAAQQTSPSRAAIRNEELARLAQALADLPEDQRTAVECHICQGLCLADTAARMGKTRPAVAGLLYRGLSQLRRQLGDKE